MTVDLGTPDGPAQLVDEAVAAFGGLDILVNNVGAVRPPHGRVPVGYRPGLALDIDDQLPRRRTHHKGGTAPPCTPAAAARS
jgi:NAD(P)-dependent dehydrogenase (short-subunit alcohol dehydrogenase family)